MLIVALVLAVVSLAALVTAVVTSNELIAWVCIGLSALGVLLLIIDAIRDRNHRAAAPTVPPPDRTAVIASVQPAESVETTAIAPVELTEVIEPAEVIEPVGAEAVVIADNDDVTDYYPDLDELERVEDHPEELVYDEPDYDTPSDDEPVYPVAAEEAAIHTVSDAEILEDDESAVSVSYAEASELSYADEEQPSADHSTTVIYSGEPYTGESSAVTESYVVVKADEPDTLTDAGDSYTVTYADEIDDESGNSGERRESDSER